MTRRVLLLLLVIVAGVVAVSAAVLGGRTADFGSCVGLERPEATEQCFEQVGAALTASRGATEAQLALLEISRTEPEAVWFCHVAAHAIGAEVARTGGAPDDLRYSCTGGTWHGYFETLGQMHSLDEAKELVRGVCTDLIGDDAREVVSYDCHHGVGHAYGDGGGDYPAIFLACEEEFGTTKARDDCADGVAMAYAVRTNDSPESLDTLCAEAPDWVVGACLARVPVDRVGHGKFTLAEMLDQCAGTTAPGSCALGAGRGAGKAMLSARFGDGSVLPECTEVEDLAQYCLEGVVLMTTPVLISTGFDPTSVCETAGSDRAWCTQMVADVAARELDVSQIIDGWDAPAGTDAPGDR